jgi:hypothetical protein
MPPQPCRRSHKAKSLDARESSSRWWPAAPDHGGIFFLPSTFDAWARSAQPLERQSRVDCLPVAWSSFPTAQPLPFSGLVTLKVMYIAQTDGRVQEEGPWFLTPVL